VSNETAQQRLVFGYLHDEALIFVPEREAVELAELRRAVGTARTWGELKANIPPKRWRQVASAFEVGDERLPSDDEPFDADHVPGYADGDWPDWPAQRMLEWMPSEVRERFGKLELSVLNGEYLALDPARESEIVSALRKAGYDCRPDDRLVREASGYA
jgi:hypothetical protein